MGGFPAKTLRAHLTEACRSRQEAFLPILNPSASSADNPSKQCRFDDKKWKWCHVLRVDQTIPVSLSLQTQACSRRRLVGRSLAGGVSLRSCTAGLQRRRDFPRGAGAGFVASHHDGCQRNTDHDRLRSTEAATSRIPAPPGSAVAMPGRRISCRHTGSRLVPRNGSRPGRQPLLHELCATPGCVLDFVRRTCPNRQFKRNEQLRQLLPQFLLRR